MYKWMGRIILSAILSGFFFNAVAFAAMQNISAPEMQKLVKQTPDTYLLDVRTLGEFVQKRIKGGRLIPIDQVQNRINEIPKNRTIIVYCETGMRSGQVARYLDSLGYKDVFNLSQGIMSWQLRGYPIESGMP